jgi:gliding motility-associated-like protein
LGWVLTNGAVSDANQKIVYGTESQGTFENGHLITSSGNDPKITTESIPMVAPGSTHSIRIGNITRGTRYDRIKTSFVVTADNSLFQYKFAVILQNATTNHAEYQKPGFNLTITDENGDELDCSYYDVQINAAGTVSDFKTQGDLQYRNWTTGAIDLRNYIGKTITLQVTAHGCTQRGHFGYAYFDAQCVKSEIKQVSKCPDDEGYITFQAPDGFEKYTWSNGGTSSSIRVKANLGDTYSVKMLPLSSLNASCELQLDYAVNYQKADTIVTATICENETIAVGDTTYATTGNYTRTIIGSAVCDSTVNLRLTVNKIIHYTQNIALCKGDSVVVGDTTYKLTGNYENLISRPGLCDSIVTTNLRIDSLNLQISPTNPVITEGDSIQLIASALPNANYVFTWSPATMLSCTTCSDPWASPVKTQTYLISTENAVKSCRKSDKIVVTLRPCGIFAPEAFSPNHDGLNDLYFVYGNSCVKQIKELIIYDRWGEVVFSKQNFPASDANHGWDGNYRGTPAPVGVYPFKAKVEFNNGFIKQYNGAIKLLN